MEKPFWVLEQNYLEERDRIERKCEEVENLDQALQTGLNSIRLRSGTWDNEYFVGWMDVSGDYRLYDRFEKMSQKDLQNIKCKFLQIDRDGDGFTIGIFRELRDK